MRRSALALPLGALLLGCGEEVGSPPPPPRPRSTPDAGTMPVPRVTVTFEHSSRTDYDPGRWPPGSCERAIHSTHAHPDWRSFGVLAFRVAEDGLWRLTDDRVPVGTRAIVVEDPMYCDANPFGHVDEPTISANGVLLRTRVNTSEGGDRSGWQFRVDEMGNVTP